MCSLAVLVASTAELEVWRYIFFQISLVRLNEPIDPPRTTYQRTNVC